MKEKELQFQLEMKEKEVMLALKEQKIQINEKKSEQMKMGVRIKELTPNTLPETKALDTPIQY
jgi:hypothetical protein